MLSVVSSELLQSSEEESEEAGKEELTHERTIAVRRFTSLVRADLINQGLYEKQQRHEEEEKLLGNKVQRKDSNKLNDLYSMSFIKDRQKQRAGSVDPRTYDPKEIRRYIEQAGGGQQARPRLADDTDSIPMRQIQSRKSHNQLQKFDLEQPDNGDTWTSYAFKFQLKQQNGKTKSQSSKKHIDSVTDDFFNNSMENDRKGSARSRQDLQLGIEEEEKGQATPPVPNPTSSPSQQQQPTITLLENPTPP